MSLPFDGFKAAQTGLVDMGNISFYNNSSAPIFNVWELAQYSTSFSEIVLNVTWAQLQASQGSLDTSFIDNAIQQVNSFNAAHDVDIGIKLRVRGGSAPTARRGRISGCPTGTMMRQAWSNDQIVGAYADSWRGSHSLFEHDHAPL